MANSQSLSKLIQRNYGRIALPLLQSTQVLLAKTRSGFNLLLRQAALAPNARKIATHELAHVHAPCVPLYAL